MQYLKKELKKHFSDFQDNLKKEYVRAFADLETEELQYLESYERLSTLEAWRAYILEQAIDSNSLDFFIEAQNDALLSHAWARIGSWRPALQALRSVLENTLFCLYYKDHPVEYILWEQGQDKIATSELINYLAKHPQYQSVDDKITYVSRLKKEYSTLSKAVHGSSKGFRMTSSTRFPALMVADSIKLSQWVAREKQVILIVNQLLLTMFIEYLQGTKLRDLRKSISLVIPHKLHDEIKEKFNIHLFKA
ncbi:MAG: hypothetical protein ABFS56_34430 [Pseudomonadota bacterium]